MKFGSIFSSLAFAATAMFAANAAQAITVVGFDNLTTGGPFGGNGAPFVTYTEDGFNVAAIPGQYVQAIGGSNGTSGPASNSILTGAFNTTQAALLTITGPSLFRFTSFDALGGSSAASFTITGYQGANAVYSYDGSVPAFTGSNTLTTYANSNMINIDRLTVGSNASNQLYFDNFTFDNAVVAPPGVPEPASWALIIAGFGMVGAGLRRRSASDALAC